VDDLDAGARVNSPGLRTVDLIDGSTTGNDDVSDFFGVD